MGKVKIALVLTVLALAFVGCRRGPKEVAPVKPGDSLEYHFSGGPGAYDAKVIIGAGKSADEYVISAQPDGGEKPVEVDRALDSGKRLKIHFLGQLWLPPSQRVVGATARAGAVIKQRKFGRFENTWLVEDYSTKSTYFFDANTGFLVGYSVRLGNSEQQASLTRSTIEGL